MSKGSKGHHHGREVGQPHHPPWVESFHPQRQPLLLPLSISAFPQKYPLLKRNRSIRTSAPSHSTFSSARTKPKLPRLEIPQAIITKPQCQDDLIIPPTPRLKGISTKETIRALGLIQPIPLARGAPAFTNPAIFGEGVPPFSSGPPSHFGGGNSIPAISPPVSTNTMPYTALTGDTPSSSLSMAPKSIPINGPGSARPLPPIPKTPYQFPLPSWGPCPEARVADPIARPRPLPPRNCSIDNGAPRGRCLPPVPLVLVKHHHTKSVPELSPPPSYESSVSPKDGPRQPALSTVVAPTPNSTATPISKSIVAPNKLSAVTPEVVVPCPKPATNVDFQIGERVAIRLSEDTLAPDIARLTQSGLNRSSTIPFISSRGNMLPPPQQPSPELSLGGSKPTPRPSRPPKVDCGAWTWSPPQCWNGPDDVQSQLHSRSRKKDNNQPVPKTTDLCPQKGPRRGLGQPKDSMTNVLSHVFSRPGSRNGEGKPRRLYSRGRNL